MLFALVGVCETQQARKMDELERSLSRKLEELCTPGDMTVWHTECIGHKFTLTIKMEDSMLGIKAFSKYMFA